ncbi:MAG: hypothetical protein IKE89_00525 [Bacilli bacterium]|nr:hypothetical protein [Bacilli bacterium]
MSILDKFKKKNEILEQEANKEEKYSLVEMNNYMLSDVRKNDLSKNTYSLSISKLSEISPIAVPTANNIKTITEQNTKPSQTLYKITNLGKKDSLKSMKDGKTFWGAIKKEDGSSTMAKLKEVKSNNAITLDPTIMMMSVALVSIEQELGEIKELSKKIYSFLEHEKESEIESDLEILNRSIGDFRFNLEDEKYLINNHKQVMDIKRTSNKNMLFYKKEIKDYLSKDKLFTTNNSLNSIVLDIQKKFRYYRLSLYIYSFSTFMEILLLGNYKTDYLLNKKNELDELDNEYLEVFNKALEYVKKNANKSLEGNVLTGLGSAGKAIGNLAEKVKIKNVDNWLNEKGDNLKQSGQNIKNDFITKFEEMKESNSKPFINQIEKVDSIYNKTKEIYFDKENIYLELS